MKLLSLDFGRSLGLAVFNGDKVYVSDVYLPQDLGERFSTFSRVIREVEPDVIAYEKVCRHLGTEAAHQYGAYEGITLKYAHENNIKCVPIYVMTAKALFGCAKTSKEAMKVLIVNAFPGVFTGVETHNAVDAFAIGLTCLKQLGDERYESYRDTINNVVSGK